MKSIKYRLLKSWVCDIKDESGKTKTLLGLKFMFTGLSDIHTIFLEKKNANLKKIEKSIKDYYINNIVKDEYANIEGEFEIEEIE